MEEPSLEPEHAGAMRVLLWSPKGSGLHYGGPGMVAYRMYRAAQPPFTVDLIHGNPAQASYPEVFDRVEHLAKVNGNAGSQVRFLMESARWLRTHAQEYDVFHGLQAFEITVRPATWAQSSGVPAIVKIAGYNSDLGGAAGWRASLGFARRRRRAVARLSGVIAISDEIAEELASYGIPESIIARIPNGVDTKLFHPPTEHPRQARAELDWPDRPTILFVGTIVRRKRPHLLIGALAKLRAAGHDCQLVLAGPETDAAYAREIRGLAADACVEAAVIWEGFRPDAAHFYRAADVFALPSATEGMANALLEAIASGLPSVVTNFSGTQEIVGEGAAVLAEAEPEALAEACGTLLDSDMLRLRLKEVGCRLAKSKYSVTAVAEAHRCLFTNVLQGRPLQ